MTDINCRVKRFGPRVALLWGILGLIMLLPATVWARGHTIYVPAPNKVDDTANLQSALDACVAYGKGCTVQLAAGTYLTSQLVEYNFQGTFKGMGQNKTTIQALPNLPVAPTAGLCKPNTTTCLWPSLIIFVDGNITVSDLTVNEPNIPATQGLGYTSLNDGIYFTGQNRTNASVQRVTVKGMPDNSATSCPDFNLCNAVAFAGEFPRSQTPFDDYFLSGTFSVSKSSFTNVQLGVGVFGFLRDSKVTIGGSPTAGNVFQNVAIGPFLTGAQNSVEEVSYNTSAGGEAIFIIPWDPAFVPSKPSLYLVHDNNLMPTGPSGGDGIFLEDDPTNHWLYALVYNNTIDAQDIGFGIAVISTTGTTILNNKISGKGGLGIGIFDDSHAAVLINDVTGFTADPSLAQIVLDGSLFGVPDTSNSTVVCKTPSDTVMDLGTNDKVIGCQQTANSTAAASAMIARPKALKKKPFVH